MFYTVSGLYLGFEIFKRNPELKNQESFKDYIFELCVYLMIIKKNMCIIVYCNRLSRNESSQRRILEFL